MRLLGVVCLVFSSVVWGQTYTISTIAGGGPPDNVLATSVGLDPSGIAVDAAGNVYFSNRANVLRLDAATGKITRVAGNGSFGYSGDGGPATLAALANPSGLAVDSLGNLYIATIDDDRVRKVSNSVITTFAGGGTTDSEGGPATSAGLRLSLGSSLAVDSAGNLYICESLIHRVRRVSNGIITTVVGKGTEGFGGDNGPALSASLSAPNGVAVDAAGNLYIADIGNGRVREVSNGIITTIAGGGNAKPGDGGLARDAALDPSVVTVDAALNVYVSSDNRVRMISNGIITTVAGNGNAGFSGDGGPAMNAALQLRGLASGPGGALFILDVGRVREVSGGIINTVAGNGGSFLNDNGPATAAELFNPTAVTVDALGNVYIADTKANRVRKVTHGLITTVAGGGTGFSGIPATQAAVGSPLGVAVDSTGNLYIVDATGIREVSGGTLNTIVSGCSMGSLSSTCMLPQGIALDSADALYFSDTVFNFCFRGPFGIVCDPNHSFVRKLSNGTITTVAGTGVIGLGGNNGPALSAQLSGPTGIAVDAAGNVFIADKVLSSGLGQGWIREVSNGVITAVAGNAQAVFSGDGGPATSASGAFSAVAVDMNGDIYTVGNNRVRKTSHGIIHTIAGTGSAGFFGDGGDSLNAQLNAPSGIAVDSAGRVYIADTGNNRIRVLTPLSPGADLTITSSHTSNFTPGQIGATYTLIVGNGGSDPTSGTVTVTDTVPASLMIVSMKGPGWACVQPAGSCMRADSLLPGATYQPISVKVNVLGTANTIAVNEATVAGGGEVYTLNDTVFDSTAIDQSAPLVSSIGPSVIPVGIRTVFIDGAGFFNPVTVRFNGPAGQIDAFVGFGANLGTGQVSVTTTFGLTGNWTVQVILADGRKSNVFPFSVSPPPGPTTFALPQFVFGGAWYSALYFANTTGNAENITVNFIGDDGTPMNVPLAGLGTFSSYTFILNPSSSVILEALDDIGTPGQGWVETTLPPGVTGYAVFRQVVPGRADQEAVVPLTPESSRVADLTYDDTAFNTAVAFLNPTNQPEVVTITASGQDGSVTGTGQVALPPRTKLATVLKTLPGLSGIAGQRGRAVFSVSSGAVSVLGLRFGGSAFTSIPVVHRPASPATNTVTSALPHIVFGGAWYTALYLSNTTNSPVSVPVSFIDNFGVPLDVPLNGIGTSIFQFVDLDPGATAILEAPNSGAPGQGWVEAGFAPGVTGYGVYRQVIPGREKQEAVVPLTSESSLTADLIYDEIVSTTSVALLNPSDQQVIVTITAYSVNGAQVGSTQVTLSPQSKVATTLKTLLGGIVGNRGWATFSVSNGAVSVLGMRFLGEAFTSIPVAQR